METFINLPDASRFLESIRHIGYTPESAICDLIDNSLSAGATKVGITMSQRPDKSWRVYIADNGQGMTYEVLKQAMQYGAPKAIQTSAFNVYGMGMKTASSAFSKRFTVVSRGSDGEVSAATWDLDEQEETPWATHIGSASKAQEDFLKKIAGDGSGTVVIWENADFRGGAEDSRAGSYDSIPTTKFLDGIKEYVEMAFGRFLLGSSKVFPKVEIFLNGTPCVGWDPIDQDFIHPKWTTIEDQLDFEYTDPKTKEKFNLPYMLKTAVILGKNDEDVVPGGKLKSRNQSRNQGIYVYRLDRVIAEPSWLKTMLPHATRNQLRATLEIDPSFDAPLDLAVKKDNIRLPQEMFETLQDLLKKYEQSYKKDIATKRRVLRPESDPHKLSSDAIDAAKDYLPTPDLHRVSASEVQISTQWGDSVTLIRDISGPGSRPTRIQVVDELPGGVLFEPVLRGSDQIVMIAKDHPFYEKVYGPLRDVPLATEGLDFLLFSLATAEWMTRTDRVRDQFLQMRLVMANTLRTLVSDLDDEEDEPQSE